MSENNTLRIVMMGGVISHQGYPIPISENEDTEFIAPRGKGVCRAQIGEREPIYLSIRFTAHEELHPDGKIHNNHAYFVFVESDGDKLLAKWEAPNPGEDGRLYITSGTGKWTGAKGHVDWQLHVTPPLSEEEWVFFEGEGNIELKR